MKIIDHINQIFFDATTLLHLCKPAECRQDCGEPTIYIDTHQASTSYMDYNEGKHSGQARETYDTAKNRINQPYHIHELNKQIAFFVCSILIRSGGYSLRKDNISKFYFHHSLQNSLDSPNESGIDIFTLIHELNQKHHKDSGCHNFCSELILNAHRFPSGWTIDYEQYAMSRIFELFNLNEPAEDSYEFIAFKEFVRTPQVMIDMAYIHETRHLSDAADMQNKNTITSQWKTTIEQNVLMRKFAINTDSKNIHAL